jgi:predicted nucleic acid-binding protein
VRAVLDTNVLLSGLLWHGAPHTLLGNARAGVLTLISSPALLAEFADVTVSSSRSRADLIVSGDGDLLILGAYAEIRIVAPAEAIRLLAAGWTSTASPAPETPSSDRP